MGETVSGGQNISETIGVQTVYFVANGTNPTNFGFRVTGATTGVLEIDNVSVKQVDPNDRWTTSLAKNVSGWLIENDVASCDGTQSTNSGFIQASVFESGKNYMLKFDLTSNGQGIKFWVNGSQNIFSAALASGSYKYEFTTTVSGSAYFEATANFVGTLDNVSVVEVQGDKPRLDYDPLNPTCPHLLLEPQSTNLVTFSEDFSQSVWTKASVSITSNSITSPDGVKNGSTMTITGGSSDQRISANVTLSGTNTISVFAKAKDSNWISLRADSVANKWYDLQNGVLGSSTITTNLVSSSIDNFGNGWYRCSMTFTNSASTNVRSYPRRS